jgi:hypothetical protein
VPNWAVLTIGGLLTLDTCVAQFFAGPHEARGAGRARRRVIEEILYRLD